MMTIVTRNTPHLDLHGEISAMVEVLLKEFINDNIKQKKNTIVVIHGKSTNILKNEVHRVLHDNKQVKSFKIDNWNTGQTIVELNI